MSHTKLCFISRWLQQSDPIWALRALCSDFNATPVIIPGKPEESIFITALLAPANKMGATFANIAIQHGPIKSEHDQKYADKIQPEPSEESWSWRDIVYKWIHDGCPLEEKHPQSHILFSTHPSGIVKRRLYGPGSIH